ncbi:MAG: type VI secretion system protein TssA [Sulfurimonas sp.]|nr:type VI secretion system protein TssA [Sulfurimonas sp.]
MDYSKLGITPINEQNPSGEDVKYDEDFELLEVEISKLTSPSAASGIDWDKVVELSSSILESKSKHILVAAYFSYGLFKKRSIDGLVDGVKVLADMIENYWESLYPPKRRIKGRVNAIEWWLNKVAQELENTESFEFDNDKKTDLIANLKRIDDFLNQELDDAPLFYNLIKLLDMKLTPQAEEEQTIVEEKVVEKIPTQKSNKQTQTISKNVEQDFAATVNNLNMLTGQMVQAKDYRSELFMINRAFAWLDVDETPTSEKNITMLNPPDTQEIELLSKLYDEKNYEDLLWAAESRITTYLFWLDLHYYVAESLKNLNHTEVSDAINQQILYFTKKLPNLENLTFSDSTPFASKTTKKWLRSKEPQKVTSTSSQQSETTIVEETKDCSMNGRPRPITAH